MRARVQPGVAAPHDLHLQLALLQVGLVDAGDLQLAARAGLHGLGDVHHLLVVKVQAGDGEVALGLGRLFLNRLGLASRVKGHHAVALGVGHVVGKHGGAAGLRVGVVQQLLQVVAVEDVVAQHQRAGRAVQELLANQKGLGQPIGAGLHGVLQVDAPLAAVAQQLREARRVLRRADDQDVPDAGQHEAGQRVINHGLVVDGQQLLAHGQRGRVQAGAGATGQDDAFACLGHGSFFFRSGSDQFKAVCKACRPFSGGRPCILHAFVTRFRPACASRHLARAAGAGQRRCAAWRSSAANCAGAWPPSQTRCWARPPPRARPAASRA